MPTYYKKITAIIILLLCFPLISHGEISPVGEECWGRGYEFTSGTGEDADQDYCVFPDGSKCKYNDFVANTCGNSFKDPDYCTPRGEKPVIASCCTGLESYALPFPFLTGTSCLTPTRIFFLKTIGYLLLHIPLIILLIVIAVIIVLIIKKIKTQTNKK